MQNQVIYYAQRKENQRKRRELHESNGSSNRKMKKIISLVLAAVLTLSIVLVFASCSTSSTKVKVIDIPLTVEEYGFGINKSNIDLVQKANAYLAEIKANGTFDAILNKYFGDGTPEPVTSAKPDSSKNQLVVATNAAFAPFEYTEGDKYLGIDMELMAGFAKYLGKELVISNMKFEAVCTSVQQGDADIAASGLTINDARKEIISFSNAYYNAAQMIIVPASNTTFDACKTTADVEAVLGKMTSSTKCGVQTGTTGQYYAKGDEDWGFDGYAFTTVGYDNAALAVQSLINGNLDFVIVDEAPAKSITASYNK